MPAKVNYFSKFVVNPIHKTKDGGHTEATDGVKRMSPPGKMLLLLFVDVGSISRNDGRSVNFFR